MKKILFKFLLKQSILEFIATFIGFNYIFIEFFL